MTDHLHFDRTPSVLFVCTANRIRSPMAAAILMRLLQSCDPNWKNWRIESAGTWTKPNLPPMPNALQAMQQRNLDISQHRSRPVSREILNQFHLILTMESGHKEALQVEFPEVARRVFMLSEMAGLQKNIPDPIGGKKEEYEKTAGAIEQMLVDGCQKIIELARR